MKTNMNIFISSLSKENLDSYVENINIKSPKTLQTKDTFIKGIQKNLEQNLESVGIWLYSAPWDFPENKLTSKELHEYLKVWKRYHQQIIKIKNKYGNRFILTNKKNNISDQLIKELTSEKNDLSENSTIIETLSSKNDYIQALFKLVDEEAYNIFNLLEQPNQASPQPPKISIEKFIELNTKISDYGSGENKSLALVNNLELKLVDYKNKLESQNQHISAINMERTYLLEENSKLKFSLKEAQDEFSIYKKHTDDELETLNTKLMKENTKTNELAANIKELELARDSIAKLDENVKIVKEENDLILSTLHVTQEELEHYLTEEKQIYKHIEEANITINKSISFILNQCNLINQQSSIIASQTELNDDLEGYKIENMLLVNLMVEAKKTLDDSYNFIQNKANRTSQDTINLLNKVNEEQLELTLKNKVLEAKLNIFEEQIFGYESSTSYIDNSLISAEKTMSNACKLIAKLASESRQD